MQVKLASFHCQEEKLEQFPGCCTYFGRFLFFNKVTYDPNTFFLLEISMQKLNFIKMQEPSLAMLTSDLRRPIHRLQRGKESKTRILPQLIVAMDDQRQHIQIQGTMLPLGC
jgi:hypothetical protein